MCFKYLLRFSFFVFSLYPFSFMVINIELLFPSTIIFFSCSMSEASRSGQPFFRYTDSMDCGIEQNRLTGLLVVCRFPFVLLGV